MESQTRSMRRNKKWQVNQSRRKTKSASRKMYQGHVVATRSPRGGKGGLGGGSDSRGQRVEGGKARSWSTANKAGTGGFHACSRLATPSWPFLDA